MLKEFAIILSAIGCIFLVLPIILFFDITPSAMLMNALLFAIVLAYAGLNAKRLFNNKKDNVARIFILCLIASIILSLIALIMIFPFFATNYLRIA